MRLDIYHHTDPASQECFAGHCQRVADKLDMILATQEILMDNVDRLIEDVAKQSTTIESMRTFISGLKSQVAEALAGAKLSAEHEAKLASIFPGLEANTDAITAAITTAPEPAPAPTPDPVPTPVATDPVPAQNPDPAPTANPGDPAAAPAP